MIQLVFVAELVVLWGEEGKKKHRKEDMGKEGGKEGEREGRRR